MKSIKTVWSLIAKQIADINDAILHEFCVFKVISVEEDRLAWAVGEGKSQSLDNIQSRTRLHDTKVSLQCTTPGAGSTTSASGSPTARPTATSSGLAAAIKPTATSSGLAALAKPTATSSGLAALSKPTSTAQEFSAPDGTPTTTAGRKRISDISQLRLDAYVARTQEQATKQTSAKEGIA